MSELEAILLACKVQGACLLLIALVAILAFMRWVIGDDDEKKNI